MKDNLHKISLRLLLVILLPINALLAQSPTISSFSPSASNVGSTVTIKGTNFVNVTKVWFGECPNTSYTVVNDSTITAVVPNSAYTDNLALATTNGFVISQNNFRVVNPQNVMFSSGGPMNFALRGGKLFAWGTAIYGWGDSSNNARWCPFEVPLKGSLKGKTISQLSVGNAFVTVLATDNTVHTWGYNAFAQLGNDSNGLSSFVPVEITNNGDLAGKTVVQVMAASSSGYALTADGKLLAWGRDAAGEQGNGTITGNVKSPKIISDSGSMAGKFIDKIGTSIEFGIIVLASDKSLHAFGGGGFRKLGNGSVTNQIRSVVINQTGVLAGKTIVKMFCSNTGHCF